MSGDFDPPPVAIQVSGELDLHTFRPRDLPELLPEWFAECRRLGIFTVRVIHGKGSGALRSGVHALLPRLMQGGEVASWSHPDPVGGWGSTVVQLKRPGRPDGGGTGNDS